jgi:hypothetical protein
MTPLLSMITAAGFQAKVYLEIGSTSWSSQAVILRVRLVEAIRPLARLPKRPLVLALLIGRWIGPNGSQLLRQAKTGCSVLLIMASGNAMKISACSRRMKR